jgi:hypothetical protein
LEYNIELMSNILADIHTLQNQFAAIFDDSLSKSRTFFDTLVLKKQNKFQKHLNSKLFDLKKLEYEKLLSKIRSIRLETCIPKNSGQITGIAVIFNFQSKGNVQNDEFGTNLKKQLTNDGYEVLLIEDVIESNTRNTLKVNKVINCLPKKQSPCENRICIVKSLEFDEQFKNFLVKVLENNFSRVTFV